ncbi:MlaD family protein [Mycolicibacterium sp. ELW1]|uniref:MlaD family protein n=1 Tax=Mycobacteriaceae TaxID=1762 RepID=UPI0011EBF03C|nr:MlaD family protein [Mycobacterium sp. ELW1]QEN12955.1 MCE family protein [Mycobacterium sp. ELW1]
MRNHLLTVICAAIVCAPILTSCSSLTINTLPLPGSSSQDGAEIVVEFSNVLNLPDRAKVVLDGTQVGVVSNVAIAGDHVDVTARIDRGVDVPSNARAVLQQATVLGDIYLALERGPSADMTRTPLASGGRIPLSQTTSPPQLEDTIASLANFIGSGSIQRAQNTLIRINNVTPPKQEVRRVVSQVTTDLRQLSDNIDNVDRLLTSVSQTAAVLGTHTPQLSVWFSPAGMKGFTRDMEVANTFGRILPSLGSIYNGGYWLVPLLKSASEAFAAVQGTKQAVEAEYPAYRRFITDYFMPQDKYPAINVTSIIGPDGRELSGNVEQVLRMLGAVP